MSMGPLYVLFREVSVYSGPLPIFLIGWFVVLVLSFISSLYILYIKSLSYSFCDCKCLRSLRILHINCSLVLFTYAFIYLFLFGNYS